MRTALDEGAAGPVIQAARTCKHLHANPAHFTTALLSYLPTKSDPALVIGNIPSDRVEALYACMRFAGASLPLTRTGRPLPLAVVRLLTTAHGPFSSRVMSFHID